MSKWTRRGLVLVIVVAMILGLRLTVFREDPVPVTVAPVSQGRVEATVVNTRAGSVDSRLRAKMSPGLSGLVAEIPVEKGQRVRKGQLLLRLDDAEHRANHLLAERKLEAARSHARQVCLAADQAARDLTRAENLAQRNLVSTQELEDAQTRAQTTAAECTAAEAQAREAEASVASAQATLDKTSVHAPFDGVVLDVDTEVGEWISPSPPGVFIPPVLDVIDPDSLYVSAPIDEADVEEIRVGQPARITLDAFRDREFEGRIQYVASFVETSQENNRTLEVEAEFLSDELPPNLLPGLSADVQVILRVHEDVLRVPAFALLENDRVLVVRDGELESVDVEVGLRNWEYAEIVSGLSAGDRVVTSLDRAEVKAGARVTVEGTEGEPE